MTKEETILSLYKAVGHTGAPTINVTIDADGGFKASVNGGMKHVVTGALPFPSYDSVISALLELMSEEALQSVETYRRRAEEWAERQKLLEELLGL